ncbi:hypothetical protein [Acinetobacter baumannii]|uniref:hypothetical protein n=1 Tax=Acinetobacter baumannii TaxID=470 RepID=UPI00267B47CB
MVIERQPHTVNGKRIGTFYSVDGKYVMYLLLARGEKTKLLDIKNSSWRMPSMALMEAKRRGLYWRYTSDGQEVFILHSQIRRLVR